MSYESFLNEYRDMSVEDLSIIAMFISKVINERANEGGSKDIENRIIESIKKSNRGFG